MAELLDPGPSRRGFHRLQSAAICLRKFALSHRRDPDVIELARMAQTQSAALIRGSLFHVGLAHFYQRMKEEKDWGDPSRWYEPKEAVTQLARKKMEEEGLTLWLACVSEIHVCLDAYMAYWNGDRHWTPLMIEEELAIHIGEGGKIVPEGEGELYTQRVDLVAEDKQGRVWLIDHKTTFRIVNQTLSQHILDGQFLGYQVFGQHIFGDKFAGVLVNRAVPRPPFGFDRATLPVAPGALKDYTANIYRLETLIKQYEDKSVWEWPGAYSSQVCYGKYGPCKWIEECRWQKEES